MGTRHTAAVTLPHYDHDIHMGSQDQMTLRREGPPHDDCRSLFLRELRGRLGLASTLGVMTR